MHSIDPSPEPPRPRRNLLRRGAGIVVCFSPVALLVASIAYGVVSRPGGFRGLGLALLGLLLGALNAYLSFGRPLLHVLRRGSMEGYQFVSGVPGVGTLFVVVAGVLGFGAVPTAVIGLVALAFDTGGLPWFLIATWRDEGLWDR